MYLIAILRSAYPFRLIGGCHITHTTGIVKCRISLDATRLDLSGGSTRIPRDPPGSADLSGAPGYGRCGPSFRRA